MLKLVKIDRILDLLSLKITFLCSLDCLMPVSVV
jgi:hypothetical protein